MVRPVIYEKDKVKFGKSAKAKYHYAVSSCTNF